MQAEFGLVSNLISIVCRFVFQPIEEIAFNMFSKYKKEDSTLKHPLYILAKISQFLCFIGLGMIVFGTFFARIFIRIIYTEKWATDVTLTLSSICIVCMRYHARLLHLYVLHGPQWSGRSLCVLKSRLSDTQEAPILTTIHLCVSKSCHDLIVSTSSHPLAYLILWVSLASSTQTA